MGALPGGHVLCEHVFDSMIVSVLLPRFALAVAAGDREHLLREPAALAPEPGREQNVGEVSPAAEAYGIHAGMRMGEALARCPRLALVPPDPVGVADAWEATLTRLESVGAAVEAPTPGQACFDARGLRRLHGGHLDGVLSATRRALARPARLGTGPTRFVALAAASAARARRPHVVGAEEAGAFLARQPVSLLRLRAAVRVADGAGHMTVAALDELAALPDQLERLGLATLGDVAKLPRAAMADRFGAAGILAHALAGGDDAPLRPRRPGERLEESLDLPEAASGPQLERALSLLLDRLLARPERRGRTIRAAVLSATLVEGGTWRDRATFREATADPARMRLALSGRLMLLPAPAETLRLAADRLGPPHAAGRALFEDGAAERRARLREAVKQARAAAGLDAALRVLETDPDSRVPERRAVLTPFE
jgi:protein ImuB